MLFEFLQVNRVEGLIDGGHHKSVLIPKRPIGLARLEGDGEVDEEVVGMDLLKRLAQLRSDELLVFLGPIDAILLVVLDEVGVLLE